MPTNSSQYPNPYDFPESDAALTNLGLFNNHGTITNHNSLHNEDGIFNNHKSGVIDNFGTIKNMEDFYDDGIFNNHGKIEGERPIMKENPVIY